MTVRRIGADPAELSVLSGLFDRYRQHYGQPSDEPAARAWLEAGIVAGTLHGFLAGDEDDSCGMAIAVTTPASLSLGHFWQIRDLYVAQEHRGQGVGKDLVAAVCLAAQAHGALRVSLTTETDNDAAIRLYSSMGFEPVRGHVGMTLDLAGAPRCQTVGHGLPTDR